MRYLTDIDVVRSHFIERDNFPPLPQCVVTTRQCIECMDMLQREIEYASYLVMQGIRKVLNNGWVPNDKIWELYASDIMAFDSVLSRVYSLKSAVTDFAYSEQCIASWQRTIPREIANIERQVAEITREVDSDVDAFVKTRGFLANPVDGWVSEYDSCVVDFYDCLDAIRMSGGRIEEVLAPSRKYLNQPLIPFPFKIIKTGRQCADCFQLLERAIKDVYQAIDDGVMTLEYPKLFIPNPFSESYDKKEYAQISAHIDKCARRVAEISALIRNYLANGTTYIRGKENIPVNIPNAVNIVNSDTSYAERLFKSYNRGKDVYDPSIDNWFDMFVYSVAQFNLCVDAWNKRFGTHYTRARKPRKMR